MKFDLRNDVIRKIFIYSTSLMVPILFYLTLTRINEIGKFIGSIFALLTPFLLGFGIAFLLDGPVVWMQNRLYRTGWHLKTRRAISVFIIYLLFFMALAFMIWVVVPSLIDSVRVFISNFSTYAAILEKNIIGLMERFELDYTQVQDFFSQLQLSTTISKALQSSMSKLMTYSVNVVHFLTNFVIAIAASIYMILDKVHLLYLLRTITYSIFGKNSGNFLVLYSMDAKNVFRQYIVGNILDSLIVGLVTWFGCMVLGFSYAPMIGLIIGVTNIIPVFGPFLGAVPVVLLLAIINPIHAIIFAVFILILQQIDGNVLKPLILGDKLGISGFWILFSVSLGGSLFGPVGMFLGVPVFALIFEAIKNFAALKLKEKEIDVPLHSGVID